KLNGKKTKTTQSTGGPILGTRSDLSAPAPARRNTVWCRTQCLGSGENVTRYARTLQNGTVRHRPTGSRLGVGHRRGNVSFSPRTSRGHTALRDDAARVRLM